MTLFYYKAVTPSGETLEGQFELATRDEVIGKLQDAGNIPLEVREADSGDSASLFAALFKRATLRESQVVQFTQQLATLLGAGQPLDRALQILLDLPESEKAKRMLERVRDQVRGGTPLSDALEAEHGSFSRLYVNMVRAGEAGGSLDDTLARLADYLERSANLKSSVINAMIYPAFLVGMVLVSLMVLLVYVVPQFAPMFEDMNIEMPLITRVVLGVGSALQSFWWLILVAIVLAIGWLRRQMADPPSRLKIDERLLGMRVVGDIVRKVETARVARTLGTLLKNGVPLLAALTVARNVMTNTALAESVGAAAEDVKTGGGLGYALAQSKRFPKLALQMISVGEESGELDTMLMKVADTFDVEVKNTLDRLLAALVPATTIVMTVIVAMIMLAIVMPIMNIAGAVR
ncbi:type II secretion system inner membrane protein GspF [Dokdonella fugitiva]|jgi:general secretion pathway protein F|uniref:General secretion pathway protein F n=1 Tax=Dokdonella fugitiva TaxID=328517 RepID=A0A4R2IEE5_9GAMM|nr:type II secretion system inner membrane protein GspF [Dokdonella fugitiva]MBA8882484.1 general secretion pathway protein F [Dokdonella fugitiva]TCO42717.1 general secretion pathway protein F [Dokdonella fugitiva]